MSFILDQLKKSGKQRKLEMAMRRMKEGDGAKTELPINDEPAIDTGTNVGFRSAYLIVISSVFAVVVFSSALLYWKKTARGPQLSQTADSVAKKIPEMLPERQAESRPADVQKERPADASRPKAKAAEKGPLRGQEKRPVEALQNNMREARAVAPANNKKADARGRTEPLSPQYIFKDTSYSGDIIEFRQLPASVKKGLPEIKITSHLYKKDSSLVSINGRIMSAGVNLDNGLYLEEITPEGVIMSFRNYRFLVRSD